LRVLFVAAALAVASPAFAAPASPEQLERETWSAFQAGNAKEFRSMFAANFVGLYADGVHDLAREMEVMNHVRIDGYALSDMKTHVVDANDVLLTYAADVRDRVDGKPGSGRLEVASLWHRDRGRWLCLYHTEVKAK
jgi:hypothetical protein